MKRILEKVKRLLSNRIIKNYIWVFLGQNIGTAFSMLSMIVTLRIISAYDYGALVIVQTYCLIISNLFCIRTFNGFIKYSTSAEAEGDNNLIKKYVNTSLVLDMSAGIVACVLGVVLMHPITQLMEWDTDMVRYVNYYLPICFFYPILNGLPIGVLRKLNRFRDVNVIHSLVFGAQLLVLVITLQLRIGSLQLVLIEYALTEIIESVILLVYAICIMQKDERYRGFWKCGLCSDLSFIKYNVTYGLLSAFDQILGNVSTLLINRFVGNMATAYLKIISRICGVISKVTNPIGQVIYPELCKWISDKEYKKAFQVAYRFLLIVLSCGSAMLVFLSATYGTWVQIFDAGMTSAKLQSMLYLLFSVLSISFLCFHQLSFALSMMRTNLVLAIVFDLLYLVALVPVVRIWGVEGYLVLQIAQMLLVATIKTLLISRRINTLIAASCESNRQEIR